MSRKLHIFVSSVQKELERVIIQNLLNTDAFLSAHYGTRVGDISITHAEYRRAVEKKLPVLAFIKGDRSVKREAGTDGLLKELDADGPKYKRFGNVIELQKEVRAALVRLLKDQFGIAPSSDENEIAQQTIEATSTFESRPLTRVRWQDLDQAVVRRLIAAAENTSIESISPSDLLAGASLRGMVWHDSEAGEHFATAAGIVLLAKDPSAVFPQCRILADAYRGAEPDGDPGDHEDIRGPMPLTIDRAIAFIDRNTRHPMKVVGLNRVRLDEYPAEALREALVNAAAHRQYEDAGRKIMLEVFSDRLVISSPGLPPAPITLANLRKGKYRPCSRNPVLAQCLSYFHRIEERGSGFRRMRDQKDFPNGCFYPDLLIRLRFRPDALVPEFAVLQWNEAKTHLRLLKKAKSTNGISKINGQDIKSHQLFVPPVAAQKQFIEELNAKTYVVDAFVRSATKTATLQRVFINTLLG